MGFNASERKPVTTGVAEHAGLSLFAARFNYVNAFPWVSFGHVAIDVDPHIDSLCSRHAASTQ